MRYFGGKQRIAPWIAKTLNSIVAQRGAYVEPFVGSAAVLTFVRAPIRIGSDENKALITMWKALANGWEPPESFSEEEYHAAKIAMDLEDPRTAFAGFGLSFAGKWFGGYTRDSTTRNYAENAASSLKRKMQGLDGVQWLAGDYRNCPIPSGAVIYCDPPYQGTTQYGACTPFLWSEFWAWCRAKHKEGNAIFVSEYKAPDTFKEIFSIETRTDIKTKNGKEKRLEKLFVPKDSTYGEGV